MNFQGNTGGNADYKLYTGPCALQPIEIKLSKPDFGMFINITFINKELNIRTYASIKIADEFVQSTTGKSQYVAFRGDRFGVVYADDPNAPIFNGHGENYKAVKIGEAYWYEFLHTVLRYLDTNEKFFEDLKANNLLFQNVLDETCDFEALVNHIANEDLGIVVPLCIKIDKNNDYKQDTLFPYHMYRFYGKSWTAPVNNNYIEKKMIAYMQGPKAKITSLKFKEFVKPDGNTERPAPAVDNSALPF